MSDILSRLATCVELGKDRRDSRHPAELAGEDGALELTRQALDDGKEPGEILRLGMMPGMDAVGDRFSKGTAFIPELLLAAKAMNTGMDVLRPYFDSGTAGYDGTVIVGTVAGDLHDIGKNVVRMVLEGAGWKVVDLGVDVTSEKFLAALAEYPGSLVGMSALLTTTMTNMAASRQEIGNHYPDTKVFIGGAPVTQEFCDKIDASGYFADPTEFARHLRAELP